MPSLAEFKDIHRNRPAFIIGTGPSINQQDLAPLREQITFGVNGLARKFAEWGWETTYYSIMDLGIAARYPDFPALPRRAVKLFHEDMDWPRFGALPLRCRGMMGFALDPALGVYAGGTVVFTCIQLARFMGCEPIYTLGCDMNYSGGQARCYADKAPFSRPGLDERFRGDTPELARMAQAFTLSQRALEREGRRIYNLTSGGRLEALPRARYEDAAANPTASPRLIPNGPRPDYLPPPATPSDEDEYAEAARKRLSETEGEDWMRAQAALVCFELGDAASGFSLLAEDAQNNNRPDLAQIYLLRALDANPLLPMAAFRLGALARARGDETMARKFFERELARFSGAEIPGDMDTPRRAATHRALGNHGAAITDYEASLAEFPCARQLRLQLAETLLDAGRPEEAIEHIEFAVRRASDDFYAWLRLGQAQRATNRSAAAIVSLERAAALAPGSQWAHYELGLACLAERRWLDAERALTRELEDYPGVAAYVNRGIARSRMGRIESAQRDFDRALELDPDCAEAWLQIIELYRQTGRSRLALTRARAAAERFPDDGRFGGAKRRK